MLNPQIVVLLVSGVDVNAGDLSPTVLEPAVTIIIRMTIVYTDNNPDNPSNPPPLVFDVVVEPQDWHPVPCSYLQEDCVVFDNDEILMFAPNAVGGFATLTLDAVNDFTAQTDINVVSTKCVLLCQDAGECAASLDPSGVGIDFGVPVQSVFNNGFCNPSIWGEPHLTGLRGQRYDWFGEDGGWYAFLSTPDQLQMNLRVTSYLPATFPDR